MYAHGLSTAIGLKVREVAFIYCKAGAEVRLREGKIVREDGRTNGPHTTTDETDSLVTTVPKQSW